MHLNYECLRDVLIALERLLSVHADDSFEFSMVSVQMLMQDPDIVDYREEDVFYCVHNLHQAGYVDACIVRSGIYVHECAVTDITYEGHMFLRTIRDETIWTMLKRKFGPSIQASLPVVQQVAGKLILQKLGLSD